MEKLDIRRELMWLVIISVVAFAIYAPTLGSSFVYDDNRQIVRNPLIQKPALYTKALTSDVWAFKGDGTQVASNYWRPTFTAWCIANYAIFGLSPGGWHLANVLLNMLVCLLAFLILRRWGLPQMVAFGITLVFALHPVHSESVAWISGSPDLLFGIFFLGSLWFVEDWRDGKRPNLSLGLSLLFYALALGSKETAFFCLPVYFFVLCRENGGKVSINTAANRTIGFAVVAAIYFFSRMAVLGGLVRPVEDSSGTTAGLLTVPSAFVFYLRQMIFPVTMGENYPLRPLNDITEIVIPMIISVAVLAAIWLVVRRNEIARVAAAIILLPILPVLYVGSFPSDQIVHDRYLYISLLGFLMLLYFGLRSLIERFSPQVPAKVFLGAVVAIACALSYKTLQYNAVWENDLTLWAYNVKIDPTSAASFSQYASELLSRNKNAEALAAFDKSLANRYSTNAAMGRSRALISLGRYDEAISDLNRLVATPNADINAYLLYQSYEAYALALQQKPDLEKAAAILREARTRLSIYSAALTEKLAVILYLQNNKDEALKELEEAKPQARRELLPESKSVFVRLGMLYSELGRKDEARAALVEYLRLTNGVDDQVTLEGRKTAADLLNKLK